MATDSNVPVSAGAGTSVDTILVSGEHQQVVREARSTVATTPSAWAVTTTGSASVIAADAVRVKVLLVSAASSRVYLRFDSTIPTSALYHWYLEPGDRYEVPVELTALAVSMQGAGAGGTVLILLAGTA